MQHNRDNIEAVESRFLQKCEIASYDPYMEPFVLVIFGGTGDLSKRKLLPMLYHLLFEEQTLSRESYILAVGRKALTDEAYRRIATDALHTFAPEPFDQERAAEFCGRIGYMAADAASPDSHEKLCRRIQSITSAGRIGSIVYYLAVPPNLIRPTVEGLLSRNLCRGKLNPKIVIEKPFGRDRGSAFDLNQFILKHFDERQVYRIDHYLGKETVQNILFFRFGNSIFEPLWNRRYIEHVQITVAEDIGIEARGTFYEQAGVVRDIVQNHMMQLLALVAMEPPVGFEADLIRDEKVKVFRAVRPMSEAHIDRLTVRGQYGPGRVGDGQVRGYRNEEHVATDSSTPTFFAGKFYIDNWRWAGVPFYLRTGKRLARRITEIIVRFKQPPLRLLGRTCDVIEPNSLVLSIQPKEEISLSLNVKRPGAGNQPYGINLDFDYGGVFGLKKHSAYERLLLDCLKGDLTLFARADEVQAMWEIVDPVVARWESTPASAFPNYQAGTWGPKESDRLLEADGRAWVNPEN
jgi:glucose-6-phosphate 1-dehydrogenase